MSVPLTAIPSHAIALETAVGWAVRLMLASPVHRRWYLHDLERLLLPPLIHHQARFYGVRDRGVVGVVTWARLTPLAAEGLATGTRRLRAEDWTSGDEPWIIDLVTPFAGGTEASGAGGAAVRAIVRDLRHTVFAKERVRSVRRRPDGSIRKQNRWWGDQVMSGAGAA